MNSELGATNPDHETLVGVGARQPMAVWQRALLIGVALGLAGQAWLDFDTFVICWNVATLALFLFVIGAKVLAVFIGQFHRFTVAVSPDEIQSLSDASLPVYTVLVPLYKEPEVLGGLIAALQRLDYPPDKLDVRILIEANDSDTRDALCRMTLPPHIRTMIVPDGRPRTKPRACNYGLESAQGEFLVVFDAEDRPEPDQLKKAVVAFRKLPREVACLQARLNFYNGFQNLLTRWFTLEYSAWFDLYLPGLHGLGSPIPLGGSSNHFVTRTLRRLRGWDAWNVTEDCDLGMRLARAGCAVRVMDSTTWEEAPSRLGDWMRQRSRWIKGYWQTVLVHTRSPLESLRQMGAWKFLMMLATVGGQVLTLLLMPVCWAILGFWFLLRWRLFDPHEPWTVVLLAAAILLLLFNGFFILIHLIAGLRRRYYRLAPHSLLMPVYWLLMSAGAWFGFLHFFHAPFAWLKTPHGRMKGYADDGIPADEDAPSAQSHSFAARMWSLVPFAVGIVLLLSAALYIPKVMRIRERMQLASIRFEKPRAQDEIKISASWFDYTDITINVAVTRKPTSGTISALSALNALAADECLRAVVYLKVNDGEWFQTLSDDCRTSGSELVVRAPLLSGEWTPARRGAVWGQWDLRRVRAAGVKIFSAGDTIAGIKIKQVLPSGASRNATAASGGIATTSPLAALGATGITDNASTRTIANPMTSATAATAISARLLSDPDEALQNKVYEARFALDREYENPFDPKQIDVWGHFAAPSGKTVSFPAYYAQDYTRQTSGAAENLFPSGRPYWAVRFMPAETGPYSWRLSGKDYADARLETTSYTIAVKPNAGHGYLKADQDHEHFSFEDGAFFYPIGMNLCWPRDRRTLHLAGLKYHNPNDSTLLYGDFFRQMEEGRVNMGRIWMTQWWCGLEWRDDWPGFHGIGKYNLQNAWRMDYLLQQAGRHNVMLEIVLNHHGPWTLVWDHNWRENPYNVTQGGFLQNYSAALTDPRVIELFKQRHRYCVARYGAYPNLYAWVLSVELEVINLDVRQRTAWVREMGTNLSQMDGGRHMISAEYISPQGDTPGWKVGAIDYTQAAAYTLDDFVTTLRDRIWRLRDTKKPAIIEEYGGSPLGTSLNHLALQVHNAPWIGWHIPTAGAPMPWWWNFIFEWKLERYWRIFATYIEGEDLRGKTWKFEDVEVQNASRLRAMTRVSPDRAYAWVYHNLIAQGMHENREIFKDNPNSGLFEAIENASITLKGLKDGKYKIEFWSTWLPGKIIRADGDSANDALIVKLPILTRDVAIKVVPAEKS